MYFNCNTVIGRYVLSGKGVTGVTQQLLEMDEIQADEVQHKLYADAYYAVANKLTRQQLSRIKKLQKRMKGRKYPPRTSAYGSKMNTFVLPSIDYFFQFNKGLSIYYQTAYAAVLMCPVRLFITTYTEGDVVELVCKDRLAFYMELDAIKTSLRDN